MTIAAVTHRGFTAPLEFDQTTNTFGTRLVFGDDPADVLDTRGHAAYDIVQKWFEGCVDMLIAKGRMSELDGDRSGRSEAA